MWTSRGELGVSSRDPYSPRGRKGGEEAGEEDLLPLFLMTYGPASVLGRLQNKAANERGIHPPDHHGELLAQSQSKYWICCENI